MKIAICGTIASGKSEVCKIIAKRYPVLNCDELAKRCYDPKHEAYAKIINLLGEEILNQQLIDLKTVAKIIFDDSTKRKNLENIIHPYVKKEIMALNDSINFVEIALLFECGWEDLFDKIVLVTCDAKIAIDRMIKYRGYDYNHALARYNSQIDPNIQIAKADYVIYNNSTKEDLNIEVEKLLERIIDDGIKS